MSNFLKDANMQPAYHRRKRWLPICSVAVTAVFVIGCGGSPVDSSSSKVLSSSTVARSQSSSHPDQPDPTPDSPDGPVTVVRGKQVIEGVELGFPHTIVGAISAAAEVESEVFTLNPDHAAAVMRLRADSSYPTAPQDAAEGAESLRKGLGAPTTGPVPAGYSVHFKAVEYQVRNLTSEEVMVILLCEATFTQPGVGIRGRIGVFPFLMHWEHDDWRDAGDTNPAYLNMVAMPYSSKAAALGWKRLLY